MAGQMLRISVTHMMGVFCDSGNVACRRFVIYNSGRSKIFLDSVQQDPHFGEITILNAGTDNAIPGDHATIQPVIFVLIVTEKSYLLRLFVCHWSETTGFN